MSTLHVFHCCIAYATTVFDFNMTLFYRNAIQNQFRYQ